MEPAETQDEIQQLLSEQIHPAFHYKYAVERTNVWASVKNLYQQIVLFNLSQGTSASQLAHIISPDTKDIAFEHDLKNQNGEKQGNQC